MTDTTYEQALRRSPADTEYITALGMVVFRFAILEWNAASCANRLRPGVATDISDPNNKQAAARYAANILVCEAENLPPSPEKDKLLAAANEFKAIVINDRNYVYHSIPVTHDGITALSKGDKIYTASELQELAVKCFDCSLALNNALHSFLPPISNAQ